MTLENAVQCVHFWMINSDGQGDCQKCGKVAQFELQFRPPLTGFAKTAAEKQKAIKEDKNVF